MARGAKEAIQYLVWLGAAQAASETAISPSQRQLSNLAQFGFPVLPGFILSSETLAVVLAKTKLPAIDWTKTKSITAASKTITSKIKNAGLPADIYSSVEDAYEQLLSQLGLKSVELLITAAVTGQPATPVAVPQRVVVRRKGQLKAAISHLYSSLFTAKNLSPYTFEDLLNQRVSVSLLFQPLLPVTVSGTVENGASFTITAIYGRPEPLINGQLIGDHYIVDSQTMAIVGRDLNRQEWQIMSLADRAKHQKVQSLDQTAQKISDEQILDLAKWSVALNQHGELPLRLEWQSDHRGRTWITAVLPINPLNPIEYNLPIDPTHDQKISTGDSIAIGTAVGPIRAVKHRSDLATIAEGDILLTETADLVPANHVEAVLATISGWLIEAGPVKSALREQLEEYGVPMIRESGLAHRLPSGALVTIDGQSGAIYKGKVKPKSHLAALPVQAKTTATKLYIKPTILANLDDDVAVPSDGIGWLSAHMLLQAIGEHPRVSLGKSSRVFLTQVVDQLCQVAAACRPRVVIYALNDLTSQQYRELDGGDLHETSESNPLLGYRGAHRTLREPDLLKLELEAVRRVREDYGFDNLQLMLPFVRTMAEFTAVRHLILGSGLKPGRDFQLWLPCQVPANLLLLPKLTAEHLIQGVCLDLDSLTQLLLGVDHSNAKLTDEFDVRDPAVMSALEQAIATVREAGLPVTAVGRALDNHPEAIEALVAAGVTGFIVEPVDVTSIRQLTASAEQRLILDHVLDL